VSEVLDVGRVHIALTRMGYKLISEAHDNRLYNDPRDKGPLLIVTLKAGYVSRRALFKAVEFEGGNVDVLQSELESI
jgi:hypothetical protein